MGRTLGIKAQKTRDHILAQGLLLMKEQGFRNTTIREICDAAEVSVGTFYSYFNGKGDLFRYNFMNQDRAFADFLHVNIEGDTAYDRVMSFVRYYSWLNIGTGREELEQIFLRPELKWYPGNNAAFDVLYEIVLLGQSSGEITTEIEPELVTDMLKVFLRGCVYEWVMGGCAFDLEERIMLYTGQFMKSFLTK